MRGKVGALVAAGVLLVGCGSSTAASRTVTETATVTVTATPAVSSSAAPSSSAPASPSDPPSAQAGGAQPLGTTQTNGTTGHVTVHAIDRNVAAAPGDESGAARTAIDAEVCLDGPDAPSGQITTIPWYLTDASNGRYSAASATWQSDPQPQYPIGATVNPGECVRGWLVMQVQGSTEVQTARYEASDSDNVLIWSVS